MLIVSLEDEELVSELGYLSLLIAKPLPLQGFFYCFNHPKKTINQTQIVSDTWHD